MKRVHILPSLLTAGNLFCGINSILLSVEGKYPEAAWMILLAICFDILDGQMARRLKAASNFGLQFDSLSDIVSFGLAPAFLLYRLAFPPLSRLGIMVTFLYSVCGALRLARFNLIAPAEEKTAKDFVGFPIPAAAGFIGAGVLFCNEYNLTIPFKFSPLVMILLAYLMVSRISYPNFKETHLWGRKPFVYLVTIILAISLIVSHPPLMLLLVFSAYLAWGPFRSARKNLHRFGLLHRVKSEIEEKNPFKE